MHAPTGADLHWVRSVPQVGLKLVAVLREHPTDAAVVEAACATVRSICTPDDPHEPASGAFRNAQTLSKQGVADALLEAVGAVHLQATTTAQAEADAVQLTLAGTLCTALKHVAANEEVRACVSPLPSPSPSLWMETGEKLASVCELRRRMGDGGTHRCASKWRRAAA
jgi:hypothetical protein